MKIYAYIVFTFVVLSAVKADDYTVYRYNGNCVNDNEILMMVPKGLNINDMSIEPYCDENGNLKMRKKETRPEDGNFGGRFANRPKYETPCRRVYKYMKHAFFSFLEALGVSDDRYIPEK